MVKEFIDKDNWFDEAACIEADMNVFFTNDKISFREAKRICAGCIVQINCLTYAIENRIKFGLWGGKTEREIRIILRKTKAVSEKLNDAATEVPAPEPNMSITPRDSPMPALDGDVVGQTNSQNAKNMSPNNH